MTDHLSRPREARWEALLTFVPAVWRRQACDVIVDIENEARAERQEKDAKIADEHSEYGVARMIAAAIRGRDDAASE